MKYTIKELPEKDFDPFVLELVIESKAELDELISAMGGMVAGTSYDTWMALKKYRDAL